MRSQINNKNARSIRSDESGFKSLPINTLLSVQKVQAITAPCWTHSHVGHIQRQSVKCFGALSSPHISSKASTKMPYFQMGNPCCLPTQIKRNTDSTRHCQQSHHMRRLQFVSLSVSPALAARINCLFRKINQERSRG